MTLSICYRCGACGHHDLVIVPAWGIGLENTYRLCEKCIEDLINLKFKVENVSKSEVKINE